WRRFPRGEASVRLAYPSFGGGGVDVLVNAAGIAPNATADEITLDEWVHVFAVNTRGTFLTNQAAFKRMRQGGGRIINFASAAGVGGQPGKAHMPPARGRSWHGRAPSHASGGRTALPLTPSPRRYGRRCTTPPAPA